MTEQEKQEETPEEQKPTSAEGAEGEAKEPERPKAEGEAKEPEQPKAAEGEAKEAERPKAEGEAKEAEEPKAEGEAKEAEEPKAAERPKAERPARSETAAAQQEKRPARPGAGAAPHGPETAVVIPQRQAGQPVISRRRILQIGFWTSLGAGIAGMAACGVDLLYPRNVAGFGGVVPVDASEVPPPGGKQKIARGRFWLSNLTEEQGGPGLLALWWKCPHLGCTVPWRETFVWPDQTGTPRQGWFRCPCHGSTYTDAGVRVFGPAPRSMDTMSLTVENGRISVDTGNITPGGPNNPDRAVRL